jgi:hypothetical protein
LIFFSRRFDKALKNETVSFGKDRNLLFSKI